MNKLIVVALLVILSACSSAPKITPVLPAEGKKIVLNPEVYTLCEPLQKLPTISPSDSVDWDTVLAITVSNFEIHKSCADKQKNSVKLLKQFSNIKE